MVTNQIAAFGIALDEVGYVSCSSWSTGAISRIAKDGSGSAELLYSGLSQPQGLALDRTTDRLYRVSTTGGAIQVADKDGGGPVNDLCDGLSVPTGLDLDVAGGWVYWTNWTSGLVQRGRLDGSGSVETVANVTGVGLNDGSPAFDPVEQRIYWGYQSGEVMRRNGDGSGMTETLYEEVGAPDGLALEARDRRLYFAFDGDMVRAGLDGAGVPEVLFPASASNIALDYALFADGFESGGTTAWLGGSAFGEGEP